MAALEFKVRPGIGAEIIDGGFISFGVSGDIDEAFDYAATSDRLAVGDAGLIPALAGVDPAAGRIEHDAPVHPLLALGRGLAALREMEPGAVVAQAVSPLGDFRHRNFKVTIGDPALDIPGEPGVVEHPTASLWNALLSGAHALENGPSPTEELVQIALQRGRQRFKVSATAVRGPGSRLFAVYAAGCPAPLSVHPTQPEARRWALGLAREKGASSELQLEIRPVIGRNDNEPFIRIERNRVALTAVFRATFAEPKRDVPRVNGWVFYGRLPA
jgi:hypothetical protein